VQSTRLAVCFDSRRVARANRSEDINPQSHVRLGVFFAENLQNQPGAKVLTAHGPQQLASHSVCSGPWKHSEKIFYCKNSSNCHVFFVKTMLTYLQFMIFVIKSKVAYFSDHKAHLKSFDFLKNRKCTL